MNDEWDHSLLPYPPTSEAEPGAPYGGAFYWYQPMQSYPRLASSNNNKFDNPDRPGMTHVVFKMHQ
jgi:hypothetical protein